MIRISNDTHLALWSAILDVFYDNDMINRHSPLPIAVQIRHTEDEARRANDALTKLNVRDRTSYAIGEETDQKRIESIDPDLKIAGNILNEIFETYE